MKKRTKWIATAVILVVVIALSVTAVSATILTSGSYRIQRNTMGGAQAPGGLMSSASYQVDGAFGGMIGNVGSGSTSSLCIGYVCNGTFSTFLPLTIR
jgi:hypothetical protein